MKSCPFFLLSFTFSILISTFGYSQGDSSAQNSSGIQRSSPTPETTDKTSLKIINLHLSARGGKEALRNIQNLVFLGEESQGQNEFNIRMVMAPPGKVFIEKTRDHLGWKYLTIKGTDGNQAWSQEILPDERNPEPLNPKDSAMVMLEAELPVLFAYWEQQGHVFKYLGESEISNRKAYKIRGFLSNGLNVDFYFDQKTFQLLNYKLEDDFAGKTNLVNRMPTGLRKIEGVWFETGYNFRIEGKSYRKVKFNEMRVNQPIEDTNFSMPKKREIWLRGR